MERSYWLGRGRTSRANAHAATSAEARLIHYELAGRYNIKAEEARAMASTACATAS